MVASLAQQPPGLGPCCEGVLAFIARGPVSALGRRRRRSVLPCPPSEEALRAVLESARVDCAAFGVGGAKPLPALLQELREGASRLELDRETGRVVRCVEPVFVQLRYCGRVLVERASILPNGHRRERHALLAEKRERGDRDAVASAVRGVREELRVEVGPGLEGLAHRPEEDCTFTEQKDSASYPGIPAVYETHHVCFDIAAGSAAEAAFAACGLPGCRDFETEEAKGNGTMRCLWAWLDIDTARTSGVKGLPSVDGGPSKHSL